MHLKLKKANQRLALRQNSYSNTMSHRGFVNASKPKGIPGGYKRPGSPKK